ncbi:MAG: coatomer protein alpha subunit [Linnemannia elongata]|nr:MAG: coatomer protein alpha subunit [Linnemannia elongata]
MQMLTKFESKSNRVKGIAFHPKRPWILAALHNGSIQLWDYRMGTLLERFDEHDGPVRGIAFHPSQPLFVSAGDDYKIKVWNYKTRRCQFTLTGHLDYVRTVYFHHEHPWIISCSDDQTIRIWNWQSRSCIAILTGHNHYVYSAQFHPKEDLVVSASLDQTVRVWDISGLRKKNAAPGTVAYDESAHRASQQADIFGSTDAIVKFVLEGHDRSVNWASFHPTLPLIVSAGDDRQVKLWRMNDSRAWEVDSCRGHTNNVSCTIFHHRQELILSVGEDKTIRVWDMSKRTAVQTFRREHDRFWALAAHPELNLFAAGHDNGLIVFKLERERPAYSVHQNNLFYIKDKYLRVHDYANSQDTAVLAVRRTGSQFIQPRALSYNPAERAVLITSTVDGGTYELYNLPKDYAGEAREPSNDGKRGAGNSAIFIARNRFAVLEKATQTITIRDLQNNSTKSFTPPSAVNEIFYAGTGQLLLSTPTSVILFDIQQRRTIAEVTTPPVKYVVWSADMSHVALLSKHTITIATKSLEQTCLIHETIRIKSAAWDESGILIYSTLNHIKYALPQGDNGIIRTLDQPIYLTRIKGKNVYCLDRDGKTRTIAIDPTEYRFKQALTKRNYDEVLQIIRNSNLVGQSIIAYLQKKGYPEIALHFVREDKTRFELALECGNLEVGLETAKVMDKEECWVKLAQEALRQGNHQIVEMCYQRIKNFDRLSFLYLATGNTEKLTKMLKIAELRGDAMSRFHNSIFLGNVEERIRLLREVGQTPLAYMTAKTHGMHEVADEILESAGLTPEDVADLPTQGTLLVPPRPLMRVHDSNWPQLAVSRSYFEGAFTGDMEGVAPQVPLVAHEPEPQADQWGVDDEFSIPALDHKGASLAVNNDALDIDGDGGWDLDADLTAELHAETGAIVAEDSGLVIPVAGQSEAEIWCQNSPLAADHVAAGAFESAMQLLNRQVGAVNFEPLKDQFLSIFQASRAILTGNEGMPSITLPVRRNPGEVDQRKALPVLVKNFQALISNELQEAYKATTSNKITEACTLFRSILHALLLTIVTQASEAEEALQLVGVCREYILGLSIELSRREGQNDTSPAGVKRMLELAAYFTGAQLQPKHMIISLRTAMTACYKHRNLQSAQTFARRLLELAPPGQAATLARQIQQVAERNPRDEIQLDYDQYNAFVVCGISYTPIYRGSPSVQCPYCRAHFKPEFQGNLCTICDISQIGGSGTGMVSMA